MAVRGGLKTTSKRKAAEAVVAVAVAWKFRC